MNSQKNDPARVDEKRVTNPRPGHADLTGVMKYNHTPMMCATCWSAPAPVRQPLG